MIWVGWDLHKKYLTACALDDAGGETAMPGGVRGVAHPDDQLGDVGRVNRSQPGAGRDHAVPEGQQGVELIADPQGPGSGVGEQVVQRGVAGGRELRAQQGVAFGDRLGQRLEDQVLARSRARSCC